MRDNDPQPYATLGAFPLDPVDGTPSTATTVKEGMTIRFTVIRSRLVGEQTLDLEISQEGDFLADSHPDGLTIPADGRIQVEFGATDLWLQFEVHTTDDLIAEENGSVTLTVLPRANDPLYPTPPEPETLTVLDDDAAPAVTVSADAESVTEGSPVNFTVSRTNAPGEHRRAMFVELEISQTGDVLVSGSYPQIVQGYFSASGTTNVFPLATVDDLIAEEHGTMTVRVLPPAPADAGVYVVGAPDRAIVTVLDDDPRVSVSPVVATVTEGTDVEFSFSRVGSTADALSVGVHILGHKKVMSAATQALVEQTALPADTYVTFDAGVSEATLTLITEADLMNEGDGEIKVAMAGSPTYQIDGTGSAKVLVQDDDIPEVTLHWLSPALTLEDGVWVGDIVEATEIDYEVRCTGNTLAPPRVDGLPYRLRIPTRIQNVLNHPGNPQYNTDPFIRMPCADQPAPAGFTLHRGSVSRRYTGPDGGEILIDLLPQQLAVSDAIPAYCFLDFVGGSRRNVRFCPKFTLGAVTSARINVLNRNPTVTVEAFADEVTEGEPARFKVSRIWNADNVSQWPTTFDLTAAATGDYVTGMLPSGSRTFALGESTIMIEIPTENDLVPGADGSVTLELLPGLPETQAENGGGSYVIYDKIPGMTPAGKSARVATVQVLNDDVFPLLSIPDASALEGDPIEFVATLSNAHDQAISVDWSVTDGTAVAGSDYSDQSGTLSFAVGETEKTISITISEDAVPELDETFTLTLANPVQVTLPAGAITGTIANDDGVPIVTITPRATPVEEHQDPWFILSRQGFTVDRLEVNLSLTKDGVDLPDRLVRIPAGEQSRTFRINHVNDTAPTVTEYVYVATIAANATDYAIGTPGSATVTVLNDDAERNLADIVNIAPDRFDETGDVLTVTYLLYNEGNVVTAAPITAHSTLFGSFVASDNSIPAHIAGETVPEITLTRDYTVTEADVTAQIINESFYFDDGISQSTPYTNTVHHRDIEFRYRIFAPGYTDVEEAEEDAGPFRVKIYAARIDRSTQSHTVRYSTTDGTARDGSDYTAVEGTLTFSSGNTNANPDPNQDVYIPITDDLLDEPFENFQFMLVDDDDPTQELGQAPVGIHDNDPPVVPVFTNTHQPSPPGTNEGWPAVYGDLRVLVQLHRENADSTTVESTSGKTVEFTYQTVDGTATGGEDFTHVSGRVSLRPGSDHWRFTIPIIDDSTYEGTTPETFSVELSDPVNMAISPEREVYTIELVDDDVASDAFMLAVSPSLVDEDAGATDFTVTATLNEGAFTEDTEVTISVVDGIATAGSDFEAVSDVTLTIPADELSAEATFTLTPINDWVVETYHELFKVTGTASGLTSSPTNGVSVQILDDDERGVTIDPATLTVDEGQTATYTVVLTSVPTGAVTVTPSAPADAPVTVSPASLSFTDSTWNTEQTVTVSAAEDVDADDESAQIDHSVAGADYGSNSVTADAVAVTVADDETPTTAVVLQAAPATIAEGGGDQTITVTATLDEAPFKEDTTVELAVGADAATPGTDFALVDSFELTIAAGDTSGSATFTLSPVNDDVDEDDEALSITGQAVVGGASLDDLLPPPNSSATSSSDQTSGLLVPVTSAALTIEDNDTRGVTIDPTTLTVGEDGGQGTYTVVLTSAPSQDATLEVKVPANADITLSPTHLYFDRDNWGDEQTVQITAMADANIVDDEVTLSHSVTGGDYHGIAVDNATVTLAEKTSAAMAVVDARGTEGSGAQVAFEVVLETAIKGAAAVEYRTVGMTATNQVTAKAGEDYTDTSGTLTSAAGETSKTIHVALLDDALNEAEEYFELVLENPTNAVLPTSPTYTVKGIIVEDDTLPVVTVTGSTVQGWSHGEEAKDDLSFTVGLSAVSSREVTVDYATRDQAPSARQDLKTATAPEDYTTLSGTLTFAAGESEKSLTVELTDNDVSEDDEVFGLQLSNPVNAVLSNQGWGLIRDEDVRGVVLVPASLTIQEGQSKTFTLALKSQPTDAVTVTLTPGAEVQVTTPSSRSLSFQTGDWDTAQTVTVNSLQDSDAVDDSTTIEHSFTGGDYEDLKADDLPITIKDDDMQGIAFSTNSVTVPEGKTQTYTVKLTSQPTATVTVAIGATILTKSKSILTDRQEAGNDLSVDKTSLKFTTGNWSTEQTVTVAAASDSDAEDEAVTLIHKASGGDYDPVPASLVRADADDDETASTRVSLSLNRSSVDEDER